MRWHEKRGLRTVFGIVPLLCLAVAGCGWHGGPLIWPGLEPLEETNQARLPGTPDDPYPERLNVVTGEQSDYEWAHARGWIRAPVGEVWRALQDPEVLVDRRRVDEWEVEEDDEHQVPVSFMMHHTVRDVITLRFSQLWRQAHVLGDFESPETVWIRGDLHTPNILLSKLRTGVVLETAAGNITEIQMIRHLDAFAAGAEDAEQYLRDLYETTLARVRGEPLPEWEIERRQ